MSRLNWLRNDTPSSSPNLTPEIQETNVSIILFSETIETPTNDGLIRAQTDKELEASIISTSMLASMGLEYEPCQAGPIKDSKNVTFGPVGKVALRWHKEDTVKSYGEMFYVVERETPLVILGAPAWVKSNRASGNPVHTVGLEGHAVGERDARVKEHARASRLISDSMRSRRCDTG
ncbi:MAG: hypothetical protein Q9220_000380 [cf. Caloplaca sp. 1 TL-2023]